MMLRARRCLAPRPAPRSPEPLKIGYSDWPGFTAWEIAKVKGLFKKHDVDVELVWFPVYTDSLTALNTGQLDCNLQTWNDAMAPLAEGIPLKAVLLLDNSFGNDALVAKPGIESPKDLKGKTIATELGTCDHFLMLKALASAGLTEKDVTYTNLTVPDAAAAFIAGKVDAAVIWQPWVSQIQREGKGKVIYSSADIPGLIPDIALCRTSVVEKRPEDIQKLVAVVVRRHRVPARPTRTRRWRSWPRWSSSRPTPTRRSCRARSSSTCR